MQEPTVTLELAKQHGLLEEEYHAMLRILGRTPTYTELGIFLGDVVGALQLQKLNCGAENTAKKWLTVAG